MAKPKSVDKAIYLQPTPARVGFSACCPRCGEGRLFSGILALGKSCANCRLDFGFVDSADGPAVFVILIIGFVVTAMAMMVEVSFSPPLWLHMLIWAPLIIGLSLWALRVCKGIMAALQYRSDVADNDRESS